MEASPETQPTHLRIFSVKLLAIQRIDIWRMRKPVLIWMLRHWLCIWQVILICDSFLVPFVAKVMNSDWDSVLSDWRMMFLFCGNLCIVPFRYFERYHHALVHFVSIWVW